MNSDLSPKSEEICPPSYNFQSQGRSVTSSDDRNR
jgi:hypothetical protein